MSDPIKELLKISKILEDRFFYAENQLLKEELIRLQKEEESMEHLSRISGIVNKAVLKELVALNIRPETLAAICLVPIIEVAWADGSIDTQEQKAILTSAKKHGFKEDHVILQEWLKHRPDSKLMDVWRSGKTAPRTSLLSASSRIFSHASGVTFDRE